MSEHIDIHVGEDHHSPKHLEHRLKSIEQILAHQGRLLERQVHTLEVLAKQHDAQGKTLEKILARLPVYYPSPVGGTITVR